MVRHARGWCRPWGRTAIFLCANAAWAALQRGRFRALCYDQNRCPASAVVVWIAVSHDLFCVWWLRQVWGIFFTALPALGLTFLGCVPSLSFPITSKFPSALLNPFFLPVPRIAGNVAGSARIKYKV